MMYLRAVHIWLLLIAASLFSWFVTEDMNGAKWGATAVILIAAFKINLVIGHFMELKWQPRPYRFVLTGWLALVSTIIIGGYWAA
jgi:membrane protein YdbS with pleckstrin-like domain